MSAARIVIAAIGAIVLVIAFALLILWFSNHDEDEHASPEETITEETTAPERTTETTTPEETQPTPAQPVAPAPAEAPPAAPSVPPPPAKELPKTGVPENPYQNCHTPGSGCENIETQVEAAYKAQQQPRQITPEQQANRDRLAELQRNGTGTGESAWVAHQREIMAKK